MIFLLHVAPILIVLGMVLVFRRPPVQAAMVGAVVALLIWAGGGSIPVSQLLAVQIAQDTLVLFASIAFVIAPGIALVVLIEKTGANQALSNWVRNLGLQGPQQLGFIVLGLAPFLESMTGFGVSLIAMIPVLLSLFDRTKALRIALAGMVVMPWGTLGLATMVGAALVQVAPTELASQSALTSAPVFVSLALMASWIAGYRSAADCLSIVVTGAIFIAVLYAVSSWLGPEIAGVCAGATVIAMGLGLATWRNHTLPPWQSAAWPYLLLFACVLAIKLLVVTLHLDSWLVVQGTQSSWRPLASPGIPLLIVCCMLLMQRNGHPLLRPLFDRSRRSLLTILCFLLMSQVMVKAGFLIGLGDVLSNFNGFGLAPLTSLLGGLGGYLTGSNVGGNVLMMPTIADLPSDVMLVLAAGMNSAAGHAALGSLPMVAVIAGLARLDQSEEQRLTRFALILVVFNVSLVAAATALLVHGAK